MQMFLTSIVLEFHLALIGCIISDRVTLAVKKNKIKRIEILLNKKILFKSFNLKKKPFQMRAVRPVTKPRDTAYIVYTSGPKDISRFLGLIDTTSEAHGRTRLVQITLIILQQSDRQKLY